MRSEAAGDFCVQGDLRGGSPGLQDLPGQAQPAVDREAPELLCAMYFSERKYNNNLCLVHKIFLNGICIQLVIRKHDLLFYFYFHF